MNENEQLKAIENYTPKKPRTFELGGDYYYRCYWASCNEVLRKWNRYCPNCGQRIDWDNER